MAREKAPLPNAAPADDKKRAIDTAMAQIERMYGKGAIMRFGDKAELNVDYIPTGSLSLDVALGIGGLPKGRIVEIYGPESSGKTTLALHVVTESTTTTSMAPERTRASVISSACSPVSGWAISMSSTWTPSARA